MPENVLHLRWPALGMIINFGLHLHFDNCSRNQAGRPWILMHASGFRAQFPTPMHLQLGSVGYGCSGMGMGMWHCSSCKGIKTDDLCRCLIRNGNRNRGHYIHVPMVQFHLFFYIFYCSLLSHIKMHEMRQTGKLASEQGQHCKTYTYLNIYIYIVYLNAVTLIDKSHIGGGSIKSEKEGCQQGVWVM